MKRNQQNKTKQHQICKKTKRNKTCKDNQNKTYDNEDKGEKNYMWKGTNLLHKDYDHCIDREI